MTPRRAPLAPLAACVALALGVASRPADAQSAPPAIAAATRVAPVVGPGLGDDATTAAHLAATLHMEADRERLERTLWGWTGLTLGAGLGTSGALLVAGDQAALRPVGIAAIGVNGALLTASVLSLLAPGPLEGLEQRLARLVHQDHVPLADAVALTEREWRARADAARVGRTLLGGTLLAGAAALGAATAVELLAPAAGASGNGTAREPSRLPVTALLGATALSLAGAGVAAIAQESAVESSLRNWNAARTPQQGVRVGPPSVTVSGDGVAVGVSGSF